LIQGVTLWMVRRTGEGDIQSTIRPHQIEMHSIEIGTDGMKKLATILLARKFHASIFVAEGTVIGAYLILYDSMKNSSGI